MLFVVLVDFVVLLLRLLSRGSHSGEGGLGRATGGGVH